MALASKITCFQDSKYHSKRLRDLLLKKSYKKPGQPFQIIKSVFNFEMSLEASFDDQNRVNDLLIK